MTDLEKKLFAMLVAILDGMVYAEAYAEDLQRITGLSKKRCEEIINDYWKLKKSFNNNS